MFVILYLMQILIYEIFVLFCEGCPGAAVVTCVDDCEIYPSWQIRYCMLYFWYGKILASTSLFTPNQNSARRRNMEEHDN